MVVEEKESAEQQRMYKIWAPRISPSINFTYLLLRILYKRQKTEHKAVKVQLDIDVSGRTISHKQMIQRDYAWVCLDKIKTSQGKNVHVLHIRVSHQKIIHRAKCKGV